MKTRATKYLKNLISVNDFKRAIEILQELSDKENFDRGDQNEVIVHSATYNNFALKNDPDIIDTQEFRNFKYNLIEFVDQIDKLKGLDIPVSLTELQNLKFRSTLQNHKKWITPVIWIIALLGISTMHFKYKKGINIKMNTTSSYVEFINKDPIELHIKQPLFQIDIDEFYSIIINAIAVSLWDELEGPESKSFDLESGQLAIQSMADEISGVVFDNINFEYLRLNENTEISIKNLQTRNHLGLHFRTDEVQARLLYQDSLTFSYSFASIDNSNLNHGFDEYNAISGIARVAPGTGAKIEITGGHNLVMNLAFEEDPDEWLDLQNLAIDSLGFVYSEEIGKYKSTLEKANVEFINDHGHAFPPVEIGQFDFLEIEEYDHLKLSSLQLDDQYVTLKMSGTVGLISTGPTTEQLTIQNPSLLLWHLKNNTLVMVLLAGGLILISVLIHLYFRASLVRALPELELNIS